MRSTYIWESLNLVPRAFPFLSLGRREKEQGLAVPITREDPHEKTPGTRRPQAREDPLSPRCANRA